MEALDKGLAVKFYPRLLFKRVVQVYAELQSCEASDPD